MTRAADASHLDERPATGMNAVQQVNTLPTAANVYGVESEERQLPAGEKNARLQEDMADFDGMDGAFARTSAESQARGPQEAGIAGNAETADQDQRGTDGASGRERLTLVNAIPLASLIALMLGGLFFFAVYLPKSRKKTTQRERGDL